MTDEPLSPIDEETNAIERIAMSTDGQLLHRYLRRILETVIDVQDSGTLQAQNGRRSLARDLMRLMAEGIESANARSGATKSAPVLARSRTSGVSTRSHGIARRGIPPGDASGPDGPGTGGGNAA